jgi:hypothetical protein
MTGSIKNAVLYHRARRRAARDVAASPLHAYYEAALGKPLPTELRGLAAQLVAVEAGTGKSTERCVDVLQPAVPTARSQP